MIGRYYSHELKKLVSDDLLSRGLEAFGQAYHWIEKRREDIGRGPLGRPDLGRLAANHLSS